MSEKPDSAFVSEFRQATNFNERRSPVIDMLVLHYTGMTSGEAALERLCDADSGVSCHYLVFEDGRTVQMVDEACRAWHAGAGVWRGESDINSRSIGIEIVNPGHELGYTDFPSAQIQAVIELCRYIVRRHDIPARNVVAHSDIAPTRKIDPGEKFPWDLLAAAGVGHWVSPAPVTGGRFFQTGDCGDPVGALQEMLASYGYGIDPNGTFDPHMEAVVTAFQRHFRPARVDGVADSSTIETLFRLCKSLEKN